jgi:hypothetical protein
MFASNAHIDIQTHILTYWHINRHFESRCTFACFTWIQSENIRNLQQLIVCFVLIIYLYYLYIKYIQRFDHIWIVTAPVWMDLLSPSLRAMERLGRGSSRLWFKRQGSRGHLVGGATKPSWKMMEFVNGKDDIPKNEMEKSRMFQTTNQLNVDFYSFLDLY